jgi:hypothetical protein
MAKATGGDVLDKERAEKVLYSGLGLPGGGQLEIRMEISADHPDPDIRGVAGRVKFFNLESWHTEWIQVAEKNEQLAVAFEHEELKVTAHEFYLRAADFYRRALVYLPESDSRMLPSYQKLKETFDKTWSLVSPPFETVQISYEGHSLDALFYPAGAHRAAVVPLFTITAEPTGFCCVEKMAGPGSTCAAGCLFSMLMDRGTADRCERRTYMLRRIPSGWPKPSSIIWLAVRTSIPNESGCTVPAWAAILARAARRRKNGSRRWRFGAAPIAWLMTFLTITRRFKIACDGL